MKQKSYGMYEKAFVQERDECRDALTKAGGRVSFRELCGDDYKNDWPAILGSLTWGHPEWLYVEEARFDEDADILLTLLTEDGIPGELVVLDDGHIEYGYVRFVTERIQSLSR